MKKTLMIDFINSKPSSFYRNEIRQLPDRWLKVIENDGDYFIDFKVFLVPTFINKF